MYSIREAKILKEKEEWKKKTSQGLLDSRFGALQSSWYLRRIYFS
jgi:hypothetical protein